MTTARQQAWLDAAGDTEGIAATLFRAIAQPNEHEIGEHRCQGIDRIGFRLDGRRGIKCGICGTVHKWVDPE